MIDEEARDVYSTFSDWAEAGDDKKIQPVLKKLGEYCEPRRNISFERYRFNHRVQEQGETYDQYRTALRKIAEGCDFVTITPEEILRDHLLFGIRDNKVRERLLRETKLTLNKTDEICRASESKLAQMKVVGNTGVPVPVNAVGQGKKLQPERPSQQKPKGKYAIPKNAEIVARSMTSRRKSFVPPTERRAGSAAN